MGCSVINTPAIIVGVFEAAEQNKALRRVPGLDTTADVPPGKRLPLAGRVK